MIKVKLTGDGTSVSHSVHLIVIAFIVIQEVVTNSLSNHYTIA